MLTVAQRMEYSMRRKVRVSVARGIRVLTLIISSSIFKLDTGVSYVNYMVGSATVTCALDGFYLLLLGKPLMKFNMWGMGTEQCTKFGGKGTSMLSVSLTPRERMEPSVLVHPTGGRTPVLVQVPLKLHIFAFRDPSDLETAYWVNQRYPHGRISFPSNFSHSVHSTSDGRLSASFTIFLVK
ncbi:hypothetical protein AZE42_11365 [Rhizopogon vesiculosus]|uniref:Uncharacterized protein n=1 Tax=Rhizopogon vesiculosus TaxID=180088 RepID=A0A1J8QGP3_9AGAM|nr:hypothetical protein AZE42_11365 [Rhizopogon vesiculosus]